MLRIENFNDIASGRRNCAPVADLTARLALEGSFLRQQINFLPFYRFVLTAPIGINREHRRIIIKPVIAGETYYRSAA